MLNYHVPGQNVRVLLNQYLKITGIKDLQDLKNAALVTLLSDAANQIVSNTSKVL